MTARWPDPDRTTIGRYLARLDLRSMKSRACYRQVLHGFQDVVERHGELGQDVLMALAGGFGRMPGSDDAVTPYPHH
ncbi:hypothetical protein NKG95_22915 [Mesorhizobium sp. M1423]|uniref:hypothetical protein n=1 Tax=Mesorhizobium sp. M1423 TaxID=2957101 RepID=UPI0033385992